MPRMATEYDIPAHLTETSDYQHPTAKKRNRSYYRGQLDDKQKAYLEEIKQNKMPDPEEIVTDPDGDAGDLFDEWMSS